jgi:F-type H+-transporting ATPase subunit a
MGTSFLSKYLVFAEEQEVSLIGFWIYVILLVGIVFLMLSVAKSGYKSKVFTNVYTAASEQLYLFIENMTVGVIGAHGRKYIPMIITLWLMIFFGNMLALFMPFSPTADLSFNLGMALISIGYVQYEGIRTNGVLGHFSHFAGPKLGIALFPITLMLFVIELVSEIMKNVSLSLRLFGNIHGGHLAVASMDAFGGAYVPVGSLVLVLIKLLTVLVQAMIFTILTCVYISLVTHHDEAHHEEATHALEPVHTAG